MHGHRNLKLTVTDSAYIRSFKEATSTLNLTFCCRHGGGSERSECMPVGEKAPADLELATQVQAKHRRG